MKLFFSFLFFILSFASCVREADLGPEWVWEQHIDSEEITRTVIRFSTRMDRIWGLKLEDSRVFYTDKIEKIRLVYATQAILDVEEARKMTVDYVEGLLNALNNNPSIRADMARAPFSVHDLEIYISLESYFGQYIDPFMVGWIEVIEGMVTYYMDTLKSYNDDNWHYRAEPYFKAAEIVRAEREAEVIYPKNESPAHSDLGGDIEGSFIDIPQYKNFPSRGTLKPREPLHHEPLKGATNTAPSKPSPTPVAPPTPTASPTFAPSSTKSTTGGMYGH